MNLSITEKCSLRCKHCAHNIPNTKLTDLSLQEHIDTLDAFFETVDFVEDASILGGEALISTHLYEVLDYISKHYRHKIKYLKILTTLNAKIDKKLLDLCKEQDIIFVWSNYLSEINNTDIHHRVLNNVDYIESVGITLRELKYSQWFDFGVNEKRIRYNEKDLADIYDNCHSPCRILRSKQIVACYPGFCYTPTVSKSWDMLPLDFEDKRKKHIILEFYNIFTEKGYVEACRYCKGAYGINHSYVVPGEQIEEIL